MGPHPVYVMVITLLRGLTIIRVINHLSTNYLFVWCPPSRDHKKMPISVFPRWYFADLCLLFHHISSYFLVFFLVFNSSIYMAGGCYTVKPDFAAPSCHELHLPRTRADPKNLPWENDVRNSWRFSPRNKILLWKIECQSTPNLVCFRIKTSILRVSIGRLYCSQ